MEKNYRNLGFILSLLIIITFFGFYKPYFSQFPNFDDKKTFYTHFHAIVSSLWIIMLIAQPLLIRYKQHKLHRKLGKFSYAIFPILILTLIPLTLYNYYQGNPFFISSIINGSLLVVFYSLAIFYKKNTALHMRFMIAIAVIFLSPTLGRIIYIYLVDSITTMIYGVFSVQVAILLGLTVMDIRNNRQYGPYLVAITGLLIYLLALQFYTFPRLN